MASASNDASTNHSIESHINSTADHPLMLRILSSAIPIIRRAGEVSRRIQRLGNLHVVDKGVNDFQTAADRLGQACIVRSLHRSFPNLKVVAEEELDYEHMDFAEAERELELSLLVTETDPSPLSHKLPAELEAVREEELVVFVDPLDATTEYTQAFTRNDPSLLHHVTVLIGIAHRGRAVAGIVYEPFGERTPSDTQPVPANTGRLVWGVVGLGAVGLDAAHPDTLFYPSDGRVWRADPKLDAGELVVTTTRSHLTPLMTAALKALNPSHVWHVGGAGYKVMLLLSQAEKAPHAFVFPGSGCKKWDTCAPEAVLRAVGGVLTDAVGRPLEYPTASADKTQTHTSSCADSAGGASPRVSLVNWAGVLGAISPAVHAHCLARVPQEVDRAMREAGPAPAAGAAASDQNGH